MYLKIKVIILLLEYINCLKYIQINTNRFRKFKKKIHKLLHAFRLEPSKFIYPFIEKFDLFFQQLTLSRSHKNLEAQ